MKSITPLPLARLEAQPRHVEALKALAHLSRLQVFFFLVRARKEMTVGEIQDAVEIPGPTLSHHLKKLREAGIVDSERRGLWAYYYVLPDALKELSGWLT